jgi:hypothetical protein
MLFHVGGGLRRMPLRQSHRQNFSLCPTVHLQERITIEPQSRGIFSGQNLNSKIAL